MSHSDPTPNGPKRGHFATKKGEVILREHEFDGIQEFDQKLPNWWLFTFYAAIVWFVGHWAFYYHFAGQHTDQENASAEIALVQKAQEAELVAELKNLSDKKLVTGWAADPMAVARGQEIFVQNCVPCHGADLSATNTVAGVKMKLPGLPLNDHVWKYGNSPMRLFQLINEGTPAADPGTNGARMQAWGQQFLPKQIGELVAFIISKVPEDFEQYKK